MGAVLLTAIGNPDPAAIPGFAGMMDTIGIWCLENVVVIPGTMVSAGAAVSGEGKLLMADDDGTILGQRLAAVMKDPSEDGIAKWVAFAKGLVAKMGDAGYVDPALFVAPTPSGGTLTGTGKLMFKTLDFAPPMSDILEIPTAPPAVLESRRLIEIMGGAVLTSISAQASVLPAGLIPPPLTAPPGGGPITGSGALL